MKLYAVISRTVAHDIGIDWIYPNIMTNDYEEILKKFNEEKAWLQEKVNNGDAATIIQNEDRIFEIAYEDTSMRRYVKIIDLY